MTIASRLLAKVYARGIRTSVENGDLCLKGSKNKFTPKLIRLLREHKQALINILTPRSPVELRGAQRANSAEKTDIVRPGSTSLTREERRELAYKLLEPAPQPDQLTVPFGAVNLPFTIWDGEQLSGRCIGIDTETYPIVETQIPHLVLASVSDGDQHFVLARDRLTAFLQLHRDHHFVAHNMQFDFWVIAEWLEPNTIETNATKSVWWEIADADRLHCTNVLQQLILLAKFDNNPKPHSLDDLASHYLDMELFGKDDRRRTGFDAIDGEPLDQVHPWYLQYAVQDAIAAVQIHAKQRTIARRYQPSKSKLLPRARKRYGLLSEKLQVQGGIVLDLIYRNGMHIEASRIEPARHHLRDKLFAIAEELEKVSPEGTPLIRRYKLKKCINDDNRGYRLNGTGYPQKIEDNIRQVLGKIAEEHGLKPPTSNTGKMSLTKGYWADHRELSPVIDLFLEMQSKGKIFGFFRNLQGDHIHPRYRPIVRSGRVSCQEPNIQQMPRDGNVREMFVPSPGHVLFTIDYKALELCTLSAVCLHKYGKSVLAEVINSGRDAHAYSYCQIHEMTEEEFTAWCKRDAVAAKAARDKIKGITFGVPGSMQPAGLVLYVKNSYGQFITTETAEHYRDKLIGDVYPEWQQYLAQRSSTVYTLTGRVRGRIKRSGQLFNTQFQGLASDGAKAVLWALMRAGYRLIGFVHDEFMIELKIGTNYMAAANDIERICCQTMAEFTPGVKISTEYALADRWSKEAKMLFNDDELRVWSPSQTRHN